MAGYGFVHERIEIKILILYILTKLPGAVPLEMLTELMMQVDGVDYFDYMTCLDELVSSGHIELVGDKKYSITQKGLDHEAACETTVAYSVRMEINRAAVPFAAQLQRDRLVRTEINTRRDGTCDLSLSLDDSSGTILSIKILVPDESDAKRLEKDFKLNAEKTYHRVYDALRTEE